MVSAKGKLRSGGDGVRDRARMVGVRPKHSIVRKGSAMGDARGKGKIRRADGRRVLGIARALRDTGGVSAIPHPVKVSVAEYLATSYRPDCDYVDGVVEGRSLGEKEHA